jgi:hypothetical protein
VKKLKELPSGCRAGENANAFLGGFRLWQESSTRKTFTRAQPHPYKRKRIRSDARRKTKGAQA